MSGHNNEEQEDATLDSFMRCIQTQGVMIHPSVRSYRFHGHGLGIRATAVIEANKTLIHVPTCALLTVPSIPRDFCPESVRKALSVHALFAAFIAFDAAFTDGDGKYAAWKATWPSFEDFRTSMPFLWPERCRGQWRLPESGGLVSNERVSEGSEEDSGDQCQEEFVSIMPSSITDLLKIQAVRYRQDFEIAVSIIPKAKAAYQQCHLFAEDSFKYAWSIVNTRCLYFDPFKTSDAALQQGGLSPVPCRISGTPPGEAHHDSNQYMVLCPLIDLFNHTSNFKSACKVSHNTSGFTATSQKAYPSLAQDGGEIFVSYGPHNNDFLLVEYGFVLPDNENMHDSINLDSVILPDLSDEQKRQLNATGYLGEYTLFSPASNNGKAGVCWRIEVVARVGILSQEEWNGFVDGLVGEDDLGDDLQQRASATIRAWVQKVEKQAEKSAQALEKVADDRDQLIALFGDDIHMEKKTQYLDGPIVAASSTKNNNNDTTFINIESDVRIAKRRHNLVLERWKQILHICHNFLDQNGL